jgi:hypothetical protein
MSYKGAIADSDHYLVTVRLCCRIAQRNNQKTSKAPLKYNKDWEQIKLNKNMLVN